MTDVAFCTIDTPLLRYRLPDALPSKPGVMKSLESTLWSAAVVLALFASGMIEPPLMGTGIEVEVYVRQGDAGSGAADGLEDEKGVELVLGQIQVQAGEVFVHYGKSDFLASMVSRLLELIDVRRGCQYRSQRACWRGRGQC